MYYRESKDKEQFVQWLFLYVIWKEYNNYIKKSDKITFYCIYSLIKIVSIVLGEKKHTYVFREDSWKVYL